MRRLPFVLAVALSLALTVTVQSAAPKAKGSPMGAINVPNGLSLSLKVADTPVTVPTGRDVPVVAATYQPALVTCGALHAGPTGSKDLWTIQASGPEWGKIKTIEVAEGATTAVDAGSPFTLKTLVYATQNKPTGKVIEFTLRVYGKAGELYDLNTLKKGSAQAPQLAFQIVDEKGNVAASGTLPYG